MTISMQAYLLPKVVIVPFYCIVLQDAQYVKSATHFKSKLKIYSLKVAEEFLMGNPKRFSYPYKDGQGNLIFTKIRLEPGYDGRSKSFHFEREENGQIQRNRNGCRKVLYRLPEVLFGILHNQTIFLVEGEKDVDTLLSHCLIATTSPGSLEWNEEFTKILKNADVVILYDYDKTGFKRRDLLCSKLYGQTKSLKVVDLPGLEYRDSHGLDVTDWLQMGNTIEQLKTLVEQTAYYEPQKATPIPQLSKLRIVTLDELLSLKLPQREMLLAPFLPTQGLVLVVAKRGVGKTYFALGIAYAVATGGSFLCWKAPIAKKVLYIDGEMPASLMQERLKKIVTMSDKHDEKDFFKLLTPDLQDQAMPDLSHRHGRDAIEPFLEDCALIVIDNISCLFRSGSENEAESWQEAQEWALDLRRRGKSVLFVHHAGKSGKQRGTSKKEDALDTVIMLKQPDDYQPEQGACFEVKFDKTRHFSGEDARSFQAQLREENDSLHWEISNNSEEELIEQIVDMKLSGHTIKSIMQKKGLTKSRVETLTDKAKAKGLLK